MGAAAGYKILTQEQVSALNKIEGGSHGQKKLAKLLDDALDVAQGDVSGLVTALGTKLTASQGAAVANLAASVDLVGVDGTGSNAAPLAGTETRLDAIETKLNALLVSLRTAGVIAT
jgi:hypothetical protein